MCGFLGEVSSKLISESSFKSLLDLSISRGPDQQGFWKGDACQMGFNRLAILDVSEAGMQPLVSPSGRFIMVLNGEVYNYKGLQKTYNIPLSALRSSSDAEVISHLLDCVPINDLVIELNGMFAIAIWDTVLETLVLIRDFSGIKPLYYGMQSGNFVFASQFDQIFKHPVFENKILRPDTMKSFFGLGYMHAPDTVFENMFQVSPGQLLIWDFKKSQIVLKKSYYKWETKEAFVDTDLKTKEAFKHCMQDVIKRQLQSDVPLATFLSSGFDSSLVTAFAKQEKPDLKAFTFGVDGHDKFDERADARVYAKTLQVEHITDTAKELDLLAIIDAHFKNMPEPFGDYSSIPTFVICQKAAQFATVMLSGDGGDELFWGYPRFTRSLNQAHWFKYPKWIRKPLLSVLRRLGKKIPWGVQAHKTYSDWILSKQIHFRDLNKLVPKANFPKAVSKTYSYKGKYKKPDLLQYLKQNEFYGHMQRVLKKVDLTSMAHSLEVRVPFLDKEMISFSNKIQSEFTSSHSETKILLKNTLYDYIPENLINKEKKGFSVPMKTWLYKELKSDFIETVFETPFYGSEFINLAFLKAQRKCFEEHKDNTDIWGLWHLYAWQKWAIHHNLINN